MPRLILELTQEDLDTLNQIAVNAREPDFATPDAKGMFEYRLHLEARESRNAEKLEKFQKTLEG